MPLSRPSLLLPHRLTHLTAWQWQAVAVLPGVLVSAAGGNWAGLAGAAPWLMAWSVSCATYFGLVWHLATRLDATATQQRAQREDTGAAMLFVHDAAPRIGARCCRLRSI